MKRYVHMGLQISHLKVQSLIARSDARNAEIRQV